VRWRLFDLSFVQSLVSALRVLYPLSCDGLQPPRLRRPSKGLRRFTNIIRPRRGLANRPRWRSVVPPCSEPPI